MKICFIWVKEFPFNGDPFFKDIGFHFSSQYKFYYNDAEKRLKISENENFIEDFYKINQDSKLSELTCIVGKNGAGKSMLLDILKLLFADGYADTNRLRKNILVVWQENGHLFYDYHENIESDTKLNLEQKELRSFSSATEVIYYSNIFDLRTQESHNLAGLSNISTNYLINHYAVNYRENLLYDNTPDKYATYKREELKNHVRFFAKILKSEQKELKDLRQKFPCKYLLFNVHDNIAPETRKQRYPQAFMKLMDYFDAKSKFIETKCSDHNQADFHGFAWRAIRSYWFLFLDSLTQYSRSVTNFLDFIAPLPEIDDKCGHKEFVETYLPELVKKLLPTPQKISGESATNNFANDFKAKFLSFGRFLENMKKAFPKKNKHYPSDPISINMKDNHELAIEAIDNYFASIFLVGDYVEFGWYPQLSSGQKAMLTLLARLNNAAQTLKRKHPKNLLILIDEGELGFHPQWQKEYVQLLLNIISQLFNDDCEDLQHIQLVITSNMPLMLSDIPRDSIIFLDQGKIDNSDYKTFAATITDLYLEPFFITDGLIGKFAELKVKEAAKILKKPEITNEEAKNLIRLLAKIDDEFLSQYLESELDSKKGVIHD